MTRDAWKTAAFVAAAVILTATAAWMNPEARRPAIFSDQGEALFPRLGDALAVKAIEVVDYDETQAVARPLKVQFRKGRWVLASHNDYPAEAAGRLAGTVAALTGLHKDLVVSDRLEDHAQYGVIDPLDQKVASLAGRGKRITLRDAQGEVLADLVEGRAVKGRPGYRYVRLPGQRRTYAVKTDADPSARFEDWVEGDLLRVQPSQIRKLSVLSYALDERLGRLANLDRTVLSRDGEEWKIEGGGAAGRAGVQGVLAALGRLRIAGARPKPPSLAADLASRRPMQMTLESVMALRQRGFLITPDGRLMASAGELQAETEAGLAYTLRFGEVVSGTADSKAPTPKTAATGSEDRYLFVTVSYRGTPGAPAEQAAQILNARFADWFYVISGADFQKLRPRRQDLAKR